MSDRDFAGGPVGRIAPKRAPVRLQDLVLLVTVPGQPEAVRSFTAEQSDEAQAYAAATGGAIENLP